MKLHYHSNKVRSANHYLAFRIIVHPVNVVRQTLLSSGAFFLPVSLQIRRLSLYLQCTTFETGARRLANKHCCGHFLCP
nr:MAG TPA: hypothetical protein [Caudoviricetes sp.]